MHRIVLEANGDLSKACAELINEANHRGGEDNITVVLARFTGDELQEPNNHKVTVELPPLEEDLTLGDNTDPQ